MKFKDITYLVMGFLLLVAGTAVANGNHEKDKDKDDSVTTYSAITSFDGTVVTDGLSSIARTDAGFHVALNTRGLAPNGATTLWFVVFNEPELCATPCECGAVDLPNNAVVQAGAYTLGGRVTDAFGQLDTVGRAQFGVLPTATGKVLIPRALAKKDAEVQLVVRSHGPALADPALLETQLSMHQGGCNINTCQDVLVSVHRSPSCKVKNKGKNHW